MEICIYGGSALVFGYRMRMATNDIDFRIIEMDTTGEYADRLDDLTKIIRSCIYAVGVELGAGEDWMNDGVKGFVSALENKPLEMDKHRKTIAEYPDSGNPSLRVNIPSLEYMLAMKCMAMRSESEGQDKQDIKNILRELGGPGYDAALEIITKFYPGMLPPKVFFGLREIMEGLFPEAHRGDKQDDDEQESDGGDWFLSGP